MKRSNSYSFEAKSASSLSVTSMFSAAGWVQEMKLSSLRTVVNRRFALAHLHFLFSIEKSNGFTKPGGEALSAGQTAG
jgi:hypothetical protein